MVNLDKKNIIWLFTFIIICLIFGNGLGGYFTFISVEGWYQTLNKPNFNPPDWVFGPVWTTLYILMGVSVWLVWKEKESNTRSIGIKIFWLQLFFNVFWTYLFFGIQKIGLSLMVREISEKDHQTYINLKMNFHQIQILGIEIQIGTI